MSILISVSATDQAVNNDARFSMGSLSPTPVYSPVLIQSARADGVASYMPLGGSGQPFVAPNGFLYCPVAITSGGGSQCIMRQSTDGGATWSTVGSGGPAVTGDFAYSSFWSKSGNKVIFCFATTATPSFQPLIFQDFNLLTDAWEPTYGSGGPSMNGGPGLLYVRGGKYLMVCETNMFDPNSQFGSHISAVSYDPVLDVWGTPFDPGANISALPNYNPARMQPAVTTSYMDATGVVGIFVQWFSFVDSPTQWSGRIFFQQINPDDSLGNFYDFPQQQVPLAAQLFWSNSGLYIGDPQILTAQDNIVLPVSLHQAAPHDNLSCNTVLIGTPISNPTTWTLGPDASVGGIDSDLLANYLELQSRSVATSCYDQATGLLNLVWITPVAGYTSGFDTLFGRLRLATTANLADPTMGWSTVTAYDMLSDGPPSFYPPAMGQSQGLGQLEVFSPAAVAQMLRNRIKLPGQIL